jgi:type I restriction enzyme S subunit
MRGEWPTVSVSELEANRILLVQDGNHGEYRPRSDEFVPSGVAFIRAADMAGGRVLFESAAKINNVAFNRITKGIGQPGDVLLSHKGTVGKVAMAPMDCPAFVCSPQTTFWRTLDQGTLDRSYLYSYLRGRHFHDQLATRSAETDMAPYVSLTSQRGLSVIVPPVAVQRSIGLIFKALDDKIELNRRMNATLEGISRAIFKSWFVDFDPVRQKAAGQQPVGMDAQTAALFPDSFEDSEIGEVPTGWGVQPISELAEIVGGSTPSTKEPLFWEGGTHCWATPKDLSNLTVPVLLETERRLTESGVSQITSGVLPIGTVLLSSRAPIGYLAVAETPVAINQGFIGMKPRDGVSNLFLLRWTAACHDEIVSRANGSTFLEISKSNFRPIAAVRPTQPVMDAFHARALPLFRQVVACERESRTLAALRDTLLPKLLSGEVRVPDCNIADGLTPKALQAAETA